jgi:deoxycytidine triphosphate deaminase
MTVLSDGAIRDLMKSDGLVADGDEAQAVHCAYEFLPGKIFPGGHQGDTDFVIDWTNPATRPTNARHTIEPSAVVWIRALQTVRMPRNMCGLWIKTNTLSRQGLMLINSSLVEPGYEGHLSCNFVNFGKAPVYITPDKPIAKLLFFRLDRDAQIPFEQRFPEYDRTIAETAAQGPSSFLQISDVAASLLSEKERAFADLDRQVADQIAKLADENARLVKEAVIDLKQAKDKEVEAMKTDFASYLKKTFSYVGLALVIIFAVDWLSDYARGRFSEDSVKSTDVENLIEREVAKRFDALHLVAPLSAQPQSSGPPAPIPAIVPVQPSAP